MSKEFLEVGDKVALICADTTTVDAIKPVLKDLGYKIHIGESAEHAIERIRYTNYDIVVLHEHFAGSVLNSNIVLHYLAWMPMAQRRYTFTCLVGASFITLDAMQAFGQSVHLVVNPLDLPNIAAVLRRGLQEFEEIYGVYRDTLNSLGER